MYLDTVLFVTVIIPQSSSSIRELAAFHGDISEMVPDIVAEALKKKFK